MFKRRYSRNLAVAAAAAGTLLVIALVLGLGLGDPSYAATRSQTADRVQAGLAQLDSLLEAGQGPAAVRAADLLFKEFGSDPLYGWQVEGRLGLALLRDGRPAEALPHLEAVMRRNPNDPLTHRNLAAALLAMGRRGRALSELRVVVELAPADYEARFEYGQVLAEFGDLGAARTELDVARYLCGNCPEPDRVLAAALMEAGAFGDAVVPLRRLLVATPDPWVRLSLVQALAGSGRDGELFALLDSLPPPSLSAQELRLAVESEGRLGRSDRSMAAAATLVGASGAGEPNPGFPDDLLTDPVFWGRVSLNLLETGFFEEGLAAVDQAIELDPDNAVYRNNRVVLLLKLERREEAELEWERVLALDPTLENKESE